MSRFTPGPWKESISDDGVLEAKDGEDTVTVCVVGNPEEAFRTSTDGPNMALIKAAPDLHAALAELIASARPENWDDEDDPEQAAAWRKADAVMLGLAG